MMARLGMGAGERGRGGLNEQYVRGKWDEVQPLKSPHPVTQPFWSNGDKVRLS